MTTRRKFMLGSALVAVPASVRAAVTSTDGRITVTVMEVESIGLGPIGALVWIELAAPGAERVLVALNDGAPYDAIKGSDYMHFFCLLPGAKAEAVEKIHVAPVTLFLK